MSSTRRRDAVTAILAALPALLVAAAAWIQAEAKEHEARAAKQETARAYDSYGEYTTEQLRRDEALLKALRDCQAERERRTWGDLEGGPVAAMIDPDHVEPQAQVVLDEVAKAEGWRPKGGPR